MVESLAQVLRGLRLFPFQQYLLFEDSIFRAFCILVFFDTRLVFVLYQITFLFGISSMYRQKELIEIYQLELFDYAGLRI